MILSIHTWIISAAAAAGAAKAVREAYDIEVTRTSITCDRLPAGFNGFTILHLSDLHTTRYGRLERRIERILSTLKADMLVLTGDLAGSAAGVEHLCRLVSVCQVGEVFAVFGNSENGYPAIGRRVSEEMPGHGIRLLKNENARVERAGDSIAVVGVEDPFTHHDDLPRAMEGVGPDEFILLLAHSPGIAAEAARAGVDLVLSGHTHGGQLRLPFLPAPYVHTGWRGPRLESGLYGGKKLSRLIRRDAGRTKVYVSRGIGASLLPVRLFCRPEIAMLTLTRG